MGSALNPANDPVLEGDALERLADKILVDASADLKAREGGEGADVVLTAAVAATTFSPEEADAMAAPLVRGIYGLAYALASLEKSRDAEVAFIRNAYAGKIDSLGKRLDYLTRAVETIAARTRYPGKTKSRALAYGRFGTKASRAKLEILDAGKALASVKAAKLAGVVSEAFGIDPTKLEEVAAVLRGIDRGDLIATDERLDTKALLPLLKVEGEVTLVAETGEVLEGVRLTPSTAEPYVKLSGPGEEASDDA